MVSKTRDKFIEVARQLFARKGVENTTMNDIASASDKGRRTIYTYFKNKKEIYDAVIEREADMIVKRFRDIVCSDLPPAKKLEAYIRARFDVVDETIRDSTTSQIISYLTLDYKRLERIRRLAVEKERELFCTMIERGIESGDFNPIQGRLVPSILQLLFQGVDYCHLRDNYADMGVDPASLRDTVTEFTLNALIPSRM
ncbi:MAG: TetR/AcrR family transcriptional regulator [Duncaniella sp.]|nr:TetR/AcrR family transcriptional regulator [Duncaniella sp.]